MRIRLPISVTGRSQITNLPVDTQILKGRTTWRNLPSIFLILHDFDYLPRFFSVSSLPVIYDVMGEVSVCELLAEEYPDVAFVIPHLGSFADDWRAQLALIDHKPSVSRFDIL